MERDWARLGQALRSAREVLGLSQAEMGARIGIGRDAVRSIEVGAGSRISKSMRAYAREASWTEDSIDAVLAGGDPTVRVNAEPVPAGVPDDPNVENSQTYAKGMPTRITLELSEGEVLDAEVIDLSAPGSSGKLVMVAQVGASDASDEEKRRLLLRWARIQRRVRDIVSEELTNP